MKNWKNKVNPFQILLFGFVFLALLGGIILSLPVSTASGESQSFVDALFTASSAVSTTGLIVVDTGSFYSLFGQIVILLWFQIGGLGYMTIIASLAFLIQQKLSIKAGLSVVSSIAGAPRGNLKSYIKKIFFFTFLAELLGAILLFSVFLKRFGVIKSLYLAVFHSVSAFCTAGFSTFSDSFTYYQNNVPLNFSLFLVMILGSLGFFVLNDIFNLIKKKLSRQRPCQLHLHSKLVFFISSILILTGFSIIFFAEKDLPVLPSLFQAVSASTTTGFNTIDIGMMSHASLFFIIFAMFIGAAPGGTAGGIKNTTFAVLLIDLKRYFTSQRDANFAKRKIFKSTVEQAYVIIFFTLMVCFSVLFLLSLTENLPFLQLTFEVFSAFGTIGLSTGITSDLSELGKILISALMIFGRVGPTIVGFSVFKKEQKKHYQFAEEEVYIG